ncbi:MAG: hypothetical protein IAC58_00710 [Firmicutes bacterium]|uniref:Uncharacterized protein n=1 Tax=Candidatus Onthovivens merdipullorum TaxID=2840889 RepID=A0A9D9GTV8_9BACL|nr:hypothetical protein [Candidatus Onthovivens merdipullorum]
MKQTFIVAVLTILALFSNNRNIKICDNNAENYNETNLFENQDYPATKFQFLDYSNFYKNNQFSLTIKKFKDSQTLTIDADCQYEVKVIEQNIAKISFCIYKDSYFFIPALNLTLYFSAYNNYVATSKYSLEDANNILYSKLKMLNIITESTYQILADTTELNIGNSVKNYYSSTRTISSTPFVEGYLKFNFKNKSFPLVGLRVDIMDDDALNDDLIATVITDENGYFRYDFEKTTEDIFGGGYDVYTRFYAGGNYAGVTNDAGDYYVFDSTVDKNIGNNFYKNYSTTFYINDNSSYKYKSLIINQILYYGGQYFINKNVPKSFVKAIFPSSEDNSSYSGGIIRLAEHKNKQVPSYLDVDVILHEYAHLIQEVMNLGDNPGGTHSFSTNMQDYYYNNNAYAINKSREKGLKIAYSEGTATILSFIVQNSYSDFFDNFDTGNDGCYTSSLGVHFDFVNDAGYNFYGEGDESAIVDLLYKLLFTNDIQNINKDDFLSLFFNQSIFTISDLLNEIYKFNRDYQFDLYEILDKLDFINPITAKYTNNNEIIINLDYYSGSVHFPYTSCDIIILTDEENKIFNKVYPNIVQEKYTISSADIQNYKLHHDKILLCARFKNSNYYETGYYYSNIEEIEL